MTSRLWLALLLPSVVGACATDAQDEVEDGANDEFLTEDAKADAFGVEDWSPDGAAVLKLTSTASKTKLVDAGLSDRVAKSIVARRAALGGRFADLADLDSAPYVGKTVFDRLLRHVTEEKLFKTSIRIPLVVEGETTESITTYNDEARAAGVTAFARYTFVDASTQYTRKMDTYDQRLQELATRANITIEGEMMRYASLVNDYTVGSLKPCFIGDPEEVPDVTSAQADDLLGDMYSLWGWKYKTKRWTYDDTEDADAGFPDEWSGWSKTSKSVLLISTNSDGGDDATADVIPPCR